MGADVRLVQSELGIGPTRSRRAPRTMSWAGSAFARWAQEVAEQKRELGVLLDTIVLLGHGQHPGRHDRRPALPGESMAGLIDLVNRGEIETGSTVLYAGGRSDGPTCFPSHA